MKTELHFRRDLHPKLHLWAYDRLTADVLQQESLYTGSKWRLIHKYMNSLVICSGFEVWKIRMVSAMRGHEYYDVLEFFPYGEKGGTIDSASIVTPETIEDVLRGVIHCAVMHGEANRLRREREGVDNREVD